MLKLEATQMSTIVSEAIEADMAAGTVPTTVSSFSELHDYVDANMYLLDAMEAAGEEYNPADEEQSARDNLAMELVNNWLAQLAKQPTAEQLAAKPEGATVTVAGAVYTRTWSGAWRRGEVSLSADQLAHIARHNL